MRAKILLTLAVLLILFGYGTIRRANAAERDTICETSLTFNTATDNALLGDESQFLRFVEFGDDGEIKLSSYQTDAPRVLEPGNSYLLMAYIHNATNPELGDQAFAKDVTLNIIVPYDKLQAGDAATIRVGFNYSPDGLMVPYQSCDCELPITVSSKADLTIGSNMDISAVAFYGDGRILPLEDNASRYGHGLSITKSKSYTLDNGVAPGYENAVMVIFQINVK